MSTAWSIDSSKTFIVAIEEPHFKLKNTDIGRDADLCGPSIKSDFLFETSAFTTTSCIQSAKFFIQLIMPSPMPYAFNLSSIV